MDKKEFLDILRRSLSGEVSSDVIKQNIEYYDQYISSQSMEEELKVIEELGDPRLIARTIIESERVAKEKKKYHGSSNHNYKHYEEAEDNVDPNTNEKNNRGTTFYTNLTWHQKITIALVIIFVILILVLIGRIIIGFLFAFGVPILLVLLLMALFRKRN